MFSSSIHFHAKFKMSLLLLLFFYPNTYKNSCRASCCRWVSNYWAAHQVRASTVRWLSFHHAIARLTDVTILFAPENSSLTWLLLCGSWPSQACDSTCLFALLGWIGLERNRSIVPPLGHHTLHYSHVVQRDWEACFCHVFKCTFQLSYVFIWIQLFMTFLWPLLQLTENTIRSAHICWSY